MKVRPIYELARDAGVDWWNDRAMRMGAALAFYTALSLSPIVLIAIAVSGLVFGRQAAQGEIVGQLRELVGTEGAKAIDTMVANAWSPTAGYLAASLGLVTLLIGATGVFAELQDSLDAIWKVQPPPGAGLWQLLRSRLLSLTMILGLGFLLLVSLLVNAALSAMAAYCTHLMPAELNAVLQISNFVVTYFVTFALFTLIFKFLPDVRVAWSDVLLGAALTALLFMIGKYLIGLYLGMGTIGSSYGAAGSFVVLLLWLYYSALLLLYGAEFTQLYTHRFGRGLKPARGAKAIQPCPQEPRTQ